MGASCDEPAGAFAATSNETINVLDGESVGEGSNIAVESSTGGSSGQRKRKATPADVIADAINKMAASMQKAAAAITASTEPPLVTNSNRIYEALARLPELEEIELLKAMDLLGDSQVKFDTFMALPDRMRVSWLRLQF